MNWNIRIHFNLWTSTYRHTYIHTYVHWSLQPFSQDFGLASHTTHIVCVNFIRDWRDLPFNVDFERQIFEKLFHGRFLFYYQSFCQKYAERKSPKKYFSYFVFDDWPGIRNQALKSNKPTHYILDHGELSVTIHEISTNWKKVSWRTQ